MNDSLADSNLSNLFDKLQSGDLSAAEQIFVHYEPYLRLLVRRQLSVALRAKFDSPDIVHSVWVDILRGFRQAGCRFTSAEHLKAYLIRATRNRFIDRMRQHRTALDLEQPLQSVDETQIKLAAEEAPDAQLEENELWSQLLTLCQPTHRELLRLKRQGCSVTEIASRTGLHEGSVRRILYDLARRFAAQRRQLPTSERDTKVEANDRTASHEEETPL